MNRLDIYYSTLGIKPVISNDKIFGNVYMIDNLIDNKFPLQFIGLSTKTSKYYFFNCSSYDDKDFVEYIVIELGYKDLYDVAIYSASALDLYLRKCNNIYSYLADRSGVEYEKVELSYLEDEGILPKYNEYIIMKKNTFNNIMMLGNIIENNKLIENKKEED